MHWYLPSTNSVFKYKLNDTNTCTFWNLQVETIDHLIFIIYMLNIFENSSRCYITALRMQKVLSTIPDSTPFTT